jgi:hypothetical protein
VHPGPNEEEEKEEEEEGLKHLFPNLIQLIKGLEMRGS